MLLNRCRSQYLKRFPCYHAAEPIGRSAKMLSDVAVRIKATAGQEIAVANLIKTTRSTSRITNPSSPKWVSFRMTANVNYNPRDESFIKTASNDHPGDLVVLPPVCCKTPSIFHRCPASRYNSLTLMGTLCGFIQTRLLYESASN